MDDASPRTAADRFLDDVLANPVVARLVDELPALVVPQWYVAGGALMQTVWNVRTGRAPEYGIGDYDVLYFDSTDLHEQAERATEERLVARFGPALDVTNQARVHLWYHQRFGGPPVRPLRDVRDAIDQFVSPCSAVGITRSPAGEPEVYAPFGFDDLDAMVARHNPVRSSKAAFEAKVARWRSAWPELMVV